MLYPQWLNFAPDFRATNTREPSGRSENDYRKLAQFFPLAFAHLSWYIVVRAMERYRQSDMVFFSAYAIISFALRARNDY
jgi:hypothetical protein